MMRLTIPEEEFITPGHKACQGCSGALAMRHALKALGRNTIVVIPACCWTVFEGEFPYTCMKVPLFHTAFETAAAASSGIRAALKAKGRDDVTVMAWAGDGGTFDIGFQALSGAVERNEDFIYVCYDNEGYMNCLSTTSVVLTKDGAKRITEINPGDEVYAFDQEKRQMVTRKCSGVFDNGIRDVYEVLTTSYSIRATKNHPFLVMAQDGEKKKCFIWKTVEQLNVGDKVIVVRNIEERKTYEHDHTSKYLSPELMEFLGIFIASGQLLTESGEVRFSLLDNPEKRDTLTTLCSNLFNEEAVIDEDGISIRSQNLVSFIKSLGFGETIVERTIPQWVFTTSKEQRKSLIKGMTNTNGVGNRYYSGSYELLKALKLLLQITNYKVGKIHWKDGSLKRGWIIFRERKGDSEFGFEKVLSVTYMGKERTFDLRVEQEHNFIADGFVVHNTGIQRSSATPYGAWTTTTPVESFESSHKKNIVEIMVAHEIPYTATACVAYPEDIIRKMKKAKEIRGAKFIHILAPCPAGWRFPSDMSIKIARLAVQTCVFPIYEVQYGKYKVNIKPNKKPIKEFLQLQGRFRHLSDDIIAKLQERVDQNWNKLLRKEEESQD